MGDFGNRLFDCWKQEFPITAHSSKQGREQVAGGSLFFGFFLLAKQKKETRQSGETDKSFTQQDVVLKRL